METKSKELFEVVNYDFFDADALKTPAHITYRIDNQGERLYARRMEDGEIKIVPSVSTVLRMMPTEPHLIKWHCDEFNSYDDAKAYVAQKAEYGTFMHILFKDLLLGTTLTFEPVLLGQAFGMHLSLRGHKPEQYDLNEAGRMLQQDLFGFVAFCQQYKVKPLAIEYIVFGERFAGCVDLVCKMTLTKTRKVDNLQSERMFAFLPGDAEIVEEREVIAMIDFKSGRKDFYEENRLQLEGYKDLWNQEFPEHAIEVVANYGCKDYRLPVKVEPYRFKQYKVDEAVAKKWSLLVDLYHTKEIKIKDRVEFKQDQQISLAAPLEQMTQSINVEKMIFEKIGGEHERTNQEGSAGAEATGNREDKNRAEGGKPKRKGKANESGLF